MTNVSTSMLLNSFIKNIISLLVFLVVLSFVGSTSSSTCEALSTQPHHHHQKQMNRRQAISATFGMFTGAALAKTVPPSWAATDCMQDCLKNCNLIAPKDPAYCKDNCDSYCAQEGRTDGLSGSVSSDGGEKGILGIGTVVKGQDKPPSIALPGLDFTTDKGRKLIGY
eukprot:CAMPEP_0194048598 /NCGR_PEP_ID=MMETSP0009_2-20130614/27821_1 /TAXON_ID=210454 /ORGANISM="Grammatophora oceanica, Strain CCMP 410" /LENGTH=167 /DNA_ID=CAMNT_0038694517 /DNA_START=128 /DNA_END=631 /DNA_ORIENTATION=+